MRPVGRAVRCVPRSSPTVVVVPSCLLAPATPVSPPFSRSWWRSILGLGGRHPTSRIAAFVVAACPRPCTPRTLRANVRATPFALCRDVFGGCLASLASFLRHPRPLRRRDACRVWCSRSTLSLTPLPSIQLLGAAFAREGAPAVAACASRDAILAWGRRSPILRRVGSGMTPRGVSLPPGPIWGWGGPRTPGRLPGTGDPHRSGGRHKPAGGPGTGLAPGCACVPLMRPRCCLSRSRCCCWSRRRCLAPLPCPRLLPRVCAGVPLFACLRGLAACPGVRRQMGARALALSGMRWLGEEASALHTSAWVMSSGRPPAWMQTDVDLCPPPAKELRTFHPPFRGCAQWMGNCFDGCPIQPRLAGARHPAPGLYLPTATAKKTLEGDSGGTLGSRMI